MDNPFFVRNLTYGIEDSLISTTGVLVAIALAGLKRREILVTGFALIAVESLSMASGAFVSEDNFMKTSATREYTDREIFGYAVVMFTSYFITGLLLLSPFLFRFPTPYVWSIVITIVGLFTLVYVFQENTRKAAIQTIIGSVILAISIAIGKYMKI